MAAILQFESQGRKNRESGEQLERSADIIIFPGVRFERLDTTQDVPVPPLQTRDPGNGLRRRTRR